MTTPHEQPQHERRCEFCKERLCNGECVFGLRINPPQPSKEGWEESLEPYVLKWESEGRTEEQKWAVRNFLSGAGANGIQSLLKGERQRLIGVVEKTPKRSSDPTVPAQFSDGWEACRDYLLTTLNKEKD